MKCAVKIEKLVIYGFGKHEDVTIELGPGMNVLYGPNESGKTTIQQFILHVLFGFPQRNSTLLRYEPKSGGKYGGQIYLHDTVYGKCIVERRRGKSAGDVKVYFENGDVGEQQALDQLLRQYDRASFESIFSFSLLQLQDFEKMNEQQLSRTLLASGTTGADHLLQIEEAMGKEMEGLFKKSGRIPELNKKLTELRQLEDALQEEMRKADQYAPAVERLKEVERNLETIHKQKESYEWQLRKLVIQKQQLPLQKKRVVLKGRLNQLQDVHFPTEGIQRYASIDRQLDEAQAAIVRIQQEMKEVDQLLGEKANGQKIIAFEQLLDQESAWHRSLSALESLKNEYGQLIEKEQQLRARLGVQGNEEGAALLTADVSIRKEEELYALLESLKQYHHEIDLIERKQKELQEEVERLKEREQYTTPPSAEEIQRAEAWPNIRQQAMEAKAYLTIHDGQQKNFKAILLSLLFLTLCIAGYGMMSKQYGVLLIALIGTLFVMLFMKRQKTDDKAHEMEALLSTYEGQALEMEALVERVLMYERVQDEQEERQLHIEMDRRHFVSVHSDIDKKIAQVEQNLQAFLATYGIDGLPSAHIIPELFRMIRDIQEVMQHMEHTQKKIRQLEMDVQRKQRACEEMLQKTVPQAALYEWIRKEYHLLTTKAQQQQAGEQRKKRLEIEWKEKAALVALLQEQIARLFHEAAVDTEEAYYNTNKIVQEKNHIIQQIEQLDVQLTNSSDVDLSLTEERLENMMEEKKESLKMLNNKQKTFMEEQAILLNKTDALLSDDASSQLQQQFEMERTQFIALAKKWASKKALAVAIAQMMTDLKEKKFPYVLEEATRLFQTLTGGRYVALNLTEQQSFEVVSKEGMRFPIVELSQATKEQAYISLRLALAKSVVDTAPYPIIMDDPFVHFDSERLAHMTRVLAKLTTHQFIYFTCDETMKEHWQQATTINVSAIGNR